MYQLAELLGINSSKYSSMLKSDENKIENISLKDNEQISCRSGITLHCPSCDKDYLIIRINTADSFRSLFTCTNVTIKMILII